VLPLANLVSTGQVELGDSIEIDLTPEGRTKFTKLVGHTTNLPEWEGIGVMQGVPFWARALQASWRSAADDACTNMQP